MSQANRTAAGGRIDRRALLAFEFDGRSYTGYGGDTLASALLANDVHLVARSFKYHRPRGILSAGAEEPNALVQRYAGDTSEPNVRATQLELYDGLRAQSQNRWPSLHWDVGAAADRVSCLMPAGFFYKTFKWPQAMWPRYEQAIRRIAGLGRVPERAPALDSDHVHAHCDLLVVGAGPAGLAAALSAARSGARVILADDQCEAGGRLLCERAELGGRPALAWVGAVVEELRSFPAVRVLPRTTITGYYDHDLLIGAQRFGEPAPAHANAVRQRLWKIRARSVILATGGIERPIVFPDNDRPGIMLAGAVRVYLNRYGVRAGSRIIVLTSNDDGYRTALDLADAGATIAAVLDMRAELRGFLPQQAQARGIEICLGCDIEGTAGRMRVESVRLRARADGATRELGCDLVAMSGGWIPNVALFAHSGGRIGFDATGATLLALDSQQALACAGMAAGAPSLRQALAQGWARGTSAVAACGYAAAATVGRDLPDAVDPQEGPTDSHHALPVATSTRKQFVDFHTDVTVADIGLAAREGYDAPEHLKRYTSAGMGTDQGKTGNVNVLGVLAGIRDIDVASLGTTTYRPPYQPLGFGVIAGLQAGELLEPVRKTPLHAWHERKGARFEDVGQWQRAWYYPRSGETMRKAVERECLAVRNGLGIFDASTLGKIDIQGADAGELLDRIYCNDFRSLAVGRCRYGIMLGQDGMVFDDGVTARLGEHHYVMTTTTSGAARVFTWLEDWRQTEWPTLKVYCTPVTEQYAQIALAGPHCVAMLSPLTGIDLAAMPYMAVREGSVAGIPARVFRVSFSGALGYEVAVPVDRAVELWTTLLGAGERFEITPYGTEAMHVLRAEMGYIVIGQETDGSVTPNDLGFERMLKRDRFFIGKRSLRRSDLVRPDRKQLVGLLSENPQTVLDEGATIIAQPPASRTRTGARVAILGHVSSAYHSPACGTAIALALVKAGRSRIGERLHAVGDGAPVPVIVTEPRFLAGHDRHGVASL